MENIPIVWTVKRLPMLPIIEIMGECSRKDGIKAMINTSVFFIEKAETFGGLVWKEYKVSSTELELGIRISFALIFKSQQKLEMFVGNLRTT